MWRDMYGIARSVRELSTLVIVPLDCSNPYPLQSDPGSIYLWIFAPPQLTRKDMMLH